MQIHDIQKFSYYIMFGKSKEDLRGGVYLLN